MYGLPQDLLIDCIHAHLLECPVVGVQSTFVKTARSQGITQPLTPTVPATKPTVPVTRRMNRINRSGQTGQGRGNVVRNGQSGSGPGGSAPASTSSAGGQGSHERNGHGGGGIGGGHERGGPGETPQPPAGARNPWTIAGIAAALAGLAYYFRLHERALDFGQRNIPAASPEKVEQTYNELLAQSSALPWVAGGLAGLWRYLTHDEEDESDPIWPSLQLALIAGLGTEALRQYSALSSLGVSNPMPKMFQNLLHQVGLGPPPNWRENFDWKKYRETASRLRAAQQRGDSF